MLAANCKLQDCKDCRIGSPGSNTPGGLANYYYYDDDEDAGGGGGGDDGDAVAVTDDDDDDAMVRS